MFGEIPVLLSGRRYTLRPSFAALYALEQRLQTTIPDLVLQLKENPAPTGLVRLILREGFAAQYGSQEKFPALSYRMVRRLRPVALLFLIQGLGFLLGEEMETPPQTSAEPPSKQAPLNFEKLRWYELYKTARIILKISDSEFWRMTMIEMSLLAAASAYANGGLATYEGVPATSDDLEWLCGQFPD